MAQQYNACITKSSSTECPDSGIPGMNNMIVTVFHTNIFNVCALSFCPACMYVSMFFAANRLLCAGNGERVYADRDIDGSLPGHYVSSQATAKQFAGQTDHRHRVGGGSCHTTAISVKANA